MFPAIGRFTPALALVLFAAAAPVRAAAPANPESVLTARDAKAGSLMVAADTAFAREDYHGAADLYARVLRRVPDFGTATRRMAAAQAEGGNRPYAIELLDSLMARDSSAWTRTALARVLVHEPPNSFVPPGDVTRARRLIRQALDEERDEPYVRRVAWGVAIAGEVPDTSLMRTTTSWLVEHEPAEPFSHLLRAQYALVTNRPELAAAEAKEARRLGAPPGVVDQLDVFVGQERRSHDRFIAAWAGVGLLALWLVAFALLFTVGAWLSRAALAAAGRALANPTGEASGLDAGLRRAYRGVLWASGAYFYVSMPILLVIVLAIGGGFIYLLLMARYVLVKLVLVVGLLTLGTAFAIVRGLFSRGSDADPGERTDPAAHPRLRGLLDRVAERVGTRAVDTVFLTPGTEIAVFERGGMRRQLQGSAERCLILGIGVLDGMSVRQFKSILAHEYGHFSNRDTAGGGLALSVRRALVHIAVGIARAGAAAWYNPAWWFVRGFHAVFMRISQGASRLQEVLADRWAASAYGSPAFEAGLTHVIDRSVRFGARASRSIEEALRERKPLANLYRHVPAPDTEADAKVEEAVREAFGAEPDVYDSHPAPKQRLAWVRGYASAGVGPEADDDAPAWSLLEDREKLETTMTAHVRGNIEAEHGVKFAETEAAAGAPA